MIYTETTPSEKLKELIHSYWKFEISTDFNNGHPFFFEVMPENTLSIVFINVPHFKGVTCLGVQAKRMKQEIFPGSVFVGIRFNPWVSIEGLFENKISTANQIIKFPTCLHETFSEINPCNLSPDFSDYHLLEKGLSNLTNQFKITSDPMVKYLCLKLESGTKIKEWIKEVPLSLRPVQKHFKKITGTTMAEFRNIHRLRNTVTQIYIQQEKITNAAFQNGYTDHAHFMNSFKKLMEGTPLKNFLTQTETIRHQL
ncbi:MAG: helix-turn-helix transcriptional regulator [Saprospiraceae bacterium]|nr:helix-turn-helix transcriptional regulator [Saprospiraceae bacterium]